VHARQQTTRHIAEPGTQSLPQRAGATLRWVSDRIWRGSTAPSVPSAQAQGAIQDSSPSPGPAHMPPTADEQQAQQQQASTGLQPAATSQQAESEVSRLPGASESASAPSTSMASPYGNTANRLLHLTGAPLRWLRHLGDRAD
jgi:hypothetical protein